MLSRLLFTAALVSLAARAPACAQEGADQAEDWSLTSVPDRQAVVATISFTSGLTIAARCMDGVYDVLITGLPDAPRRATSREIGIQAGDETEPYTSVWTAGTERHTAFSRIPAVVARDLAKGGQLQVILPASTRDGRRTRYVMDLDPSSSAIEQTLTSCGRPMVDPREARALEIDGNGQDGLPDTVQWQTMPRPSFPESVNGRLPLEGYVVLSCVLTSEGRMTECQSESEQPAGYNLWRSAERSLPRARIKLSDDAAAAGLPLAGRLVRFSVVFKMQP